MLTTLKKLWHDEGGFVNSTELIFLTTIAILGLIVGFTAMRDSVVQELGDSAAAVGQFNQSYSVFVGDHNANGNMTGPQINENNGTVTVTRNFTYVNSQATFNNFGYQDNPDIGDGQDSNGLPPTIVSISGTTQEGQALPIPTP
ncbi:hypothetical protein GC197_01330 [bacterium]|nr:hypothetical protein [bacterium]